MLIYFGPFLGTHHRQGFLRASQEEEEKKESWHFLNLISAKQTKTRLNKRCETFAAK